MLGKSNRKKELAGNDDEIMAGVIESVIKRY